ncbi:unnamed protein product [Chondrus crispus]|uniref:Uncharacterized protein n=1 Tax=Chondrus crispus TaxID=2769 RepID=R7QIY2_CHOCR|nr:unnamed protein product [Chondrus crispus]CDF37431.1 unnamed protein product [Chondrus crispus]|eukprot:XP_005717250.1 unnamed protein product [Chondrus crispus]
MQILSGRSACVACWQKALSWRGSSCSFPTGLCCGIGGSLAEDLSISSDVDKHFNHRQRFALSHRFLVVNGSCLTSDVRNVTGEAAPIWRCRKW